MNREKMLKRDKISMAFIRGANKKNKKIKMGRKFKVKIQKLKMDNICYLLEKMEKTKTKHLKHWVVLKKKTLSMALFRGANP